MQLYYIWRLDDKCKNGGLSMSEYCNVLSNPSTITVNYVETVIVK
jgi:hypothetical protein